MLNLPDLPGLDDCRSVLIAGAGGGYDIFCGLPIYFALRERGLTVHLASYSFSEVTYLKGGARLSDTLVGVTADSRSLLPYFPELHLARWLRDARGDEQTVWCFAKTGARPLVENYRLLVEHLSLDGILLVDGGVDSLMRGDEAQVGTAVEDSLSLLAVSKLEHVGTRQLACIGMGAERDMSYGLVLQNIAELAGEGAWLGACALTPEMPEFERYRDAVVTVGAQPRQEPSIINSSIVSAVDGRFGDYHLTEPTKGSRLSISPLLALYWFFDLPAVARRSLLLDQLQYTNAFQDALRIYTLARQGLRVRGEVRPPLA